MAQSDLRKKEEGCEMVGGYIPPGLHSFLYNFKAVQTYPNE